MKKPRLIAVMPERSLARGATAKMPITAVTTPIAGTSSGKTRPSVPKATLPRISARDQRDGVGLEQVGGHAGAVTDVVADVVGDGGGVARVVLGDALLDLADQVGADVGGLGEDAAADTHEHGEQRGAEAEALEHAAARGPCRASTTTAAPNRPRPTVNMPATPPVRNAMRMASFSPLLTCRGGHAHVAAHREPHADEAGDAGEAARRRRRRPSCRSATQSSAGSRSSRKGIKPRRCPACGTGA